MRHGADFALDNFERETCPRHGLTARRKAIWKTAKAAPCICDYHKDILVKAKCEGRTPKDEIYPETDRELQRRQLSLFRYARILFSMNPEIKNVLRYKGNPAIADFGVAAAYDWLLP